MIKKNKFIFGIVRPELLFTFLFVLIVSVMITRSVRAEPKGINIIKHEPSVSLLRNPHLYHLRCLCKTC